SRASISATPEIRRDETFLRAENRCCGLMRRCWLIQIVNRTPIAGRHEERTIFPRSAARLIIGLFVLTPEHVTNAQAFRRLSPVWGAIHQGRQPIVRVAIIESFGPQMTRVSEDSLAALQQHRVIVSRVGSEAGFQRQRPNYRADPVESGALNESKTWVP